MPRLSRRIRVWFAALLPLAAALAQADFTLFVTPGEVTKTLLPEEARAQEHVFNLSFPRLFATGLAVPSSWPTLRTSRGSR